MNQIMIGSNGYGSDAAYQFMYTPNLTGPQVGDALGTQILNNYFTAAGGNEITLVQAYKPTITGNTDQLSFRDNHLLCECAGSDRRICQQ